MTASIILAHPYEKSFNHAIFAKVSEKLGQLNVSVHAHDLYKENFDPVLTREELGSDISRDRLVNLYVKELLASNLLVFIHPNWWGQPPAILKGYIDRVIRPPDCYDFPAGDSGGGLPIGKLKGKTAVVFNTSNTAEERENGHFGDPLENIWKKCIFDFCGITTSYRKMFRIVADSDADQRAEWLKEAEKLIEKAVKETGK